jgi:hypothetical protein
VKILIRAFLAPTFRAQKRSGQAGKMDKKIETKKGPKALCASGLLAGSVSNG